MFPDSASAKKFELTLALGNGLIILGIPQFSAFIEQYGEALKNEKRILEHVKSAQSALEPYLSFLD